MDIETYVALAVGLTPVVVGLVEVVKRAAGSRLRARFYPVVSVVLGIGLALFVGMGTGTATGWKGAVIAGAIAGLAASRLFSFGKGKEQLAP